MIYDAIIVGAGLAGCSTAVQLAERDYDVLLLEKDRLPRHKLCGEFLSPEAQSSLRRLNVLDDVQAAGARSIDRAHLSAPSGTSTTHPLPGTALGLSRYTLDRLLFDRACEVGATGRLEANVRSVRGTLADGFRVDAGGETVRGRVVVGAYGRRGMLDRTLERPFLRESTPYVAFKAHYESRTATEPPGRIELYAASGGYCGVGPVEENRLNVCWIGRADSLKRSGGTPEAMLQDVLAQNRSLKARMGELSRVSPGFKAVSQIPLMAKSRFAEDVCMVGDAAGMIAPLCGDGMAMALSTADLAVPFISDVLEGRRSPSAFRTSYEEAWTQTFGRRMRIGRWVHAAAFRPMITNALVRTCALLPPVARWLIQATRG